MVGLGLLAINIVIGYPSCSGGKGSDGGATATSEPDRPIDDSGTTPATGQDKGQDKGAGTDGKSKDAAAS